MAGNFTVTLHHRSRYIDLEKCTGCEDCVAVCPVEVSNKFNSGLDKRKCNLSNVSASHTSCFCNR